MDIVELADIPEAGGYTPALREIAAYEAIGPRPFCPHVLDASPEPLVLGYFANRAPLPAIPDAPRVRPFQLAQLEVCVPWFARLVA
ncbi:MAG TPA: hypothetical protein VFU93_00010 [Acidimicrobiales bacterium]|nr:hypothetical protein [Acidimicrobiales bacterium]